MSKRDPIMLVVKMIMIINFYKIIIYWLLNGDNVFIITLTNNKTFTYTKIDENSL